MVTENRNFAVVSSFYPDWWNINTHRCNHINRTPLFQADYGLGRALLADWGRVGAVKVQPEQDGVKVIPQISVELAKKLRCSELPVPLFSPFYAFSVLSYTGTNTQTCSTDVDDTDGAYGVDEEAFLDHNFSSTHLLSDPIAGDQAAAALLCDRLYSGLRRNRIMLDASNVQSNAFLVYRLNELERLADMGQSCRSTTEQNDVLYQIQQILNQDKPFDTMGDSGALIELDEDDELNEMLRPPERRSNVPKRSRYAPKRAKATKFRQLPPFLKNLFNFSSTDLSKSFNHSNWLTGLDPFLIRLAGRVVNPVFQGNGLLCTLKYADAGLSFTNSRAPVLLWSPPKPTDSLKDDNALFMCSWSSSSQHGPVETCYLTLPATLLPGFRLCELDAAFAPQSNMNVITRWTDGSGLDNVAALQLTTSDPGCSLLSYSVASTSRPKLPGRARTVCLNPWLTDEWALAGTHLTSSGDLMAFVHLYSIEPTETSSDPIWSGHVVLNDPCEIYHGLNRAYYKASELFDSPSNTNKTNMMDLFRDQSFSIPTDSHFECASFPPWLRIGFGQDPSQLCLTTSRRMLMMDTRQAATAQLLFRFSPDAPENTLFSVADHFASTAPRFLADVYVLAGTAYNLLVLDKRMPLRPVLHAAHGLFGEPTYMDWTVPSGEIRDRYDLPQVLVTMCAQNPSGVTCVGLNLSSPIGPQLIGPSCAGEPLTKVLTGVQNDLPTQLLANKVVMQRLQSTYCGLTSTICQPECGQDALCGLTLTGMGDVFMHKWHFTPTDDTEALDIEEPRKRCRNWLSELRCNLTTDINLLNSDGLANGVEIDLTEINRMPDDSEPDPIKSTDECQYWSFNNLAALDDFQPTSKVVHSSQWLVRDLWSAWIGEAGKNESVSDPVLQLNSSRLMEEQMRRAELDSCTESAKNRIRRFKHILERMTFDTLGLCDESPK